jgi:hypothetical protein
MASALSFGLGDNNELLVSTSAAEKSESKRWVKTGGPYRRAYHVRTYRLPGTTRTAPRAVLYRGFIRKGARVRIITFRVTTRLQSKLNRCI